MLIIQESSQFSPGPLEYECLIDFEDLPKVKSEEANLTLGERYFAKRAPQQKSPTA